MACGEEKSGCLLFGWLCPSRRPRDSSQVGTSVGIQGQEVNMVAVLSNYATHSAEIDKRGHNRGAGCPQNQRMDKGTSDLQLYLFLWESV